MTTERSFLRHLLLAAVVSSGVVLNSGWAEDEGGNPEASPSPSPSPKTASARSAEGSSRTAESQQGSRALNRFSSDPVVYSTYQQDGKPLEVDPD